jgi:hypothetical protein
MFESQDMVFPIASGRALLPKAAALEEQPYPAENREYLG